jgi:hypothetical protein
MARTAPEQRPGKMDVVAALTDILDSDLRDVLEAWPSLPPPIKAGIMAMIGAVKGEAIPGGETRGRKGGRKMTGPTTCLYPTG